MRCIAVIPARGGSKGVPRKNLRKVGGVSLIGRSVLAARGAAAVDTVIVSTDDPEIAEEARRHGARVIRRPDEISGDTASSESAVLHVLDTLEAEGARPSVVAFLQCTSPFTRPEDVEAVLEPVVSGRTACAFSATDDHGFLWQMTDEGYAVGVNHDHLQPRKRRQDLPRTLRETGAVYAFDAAAFRRTGTRFCGPAAAVPLEVPPLEIDSLDDFRLAEVMAALHPPPVDDRLRSVRALIMDFDGVHTDDAVHVDETGRESVRCSRRDGLGLSLLRQTGIATLILSKEVNPVVGMRAAKLKTAVVQGCDDKVTALSAWLAQHGFTPEDALYIGNDVNDLGCMRMVGLCAAPADAMPQVRAIAHIVTAAPGGNGAVREICDRLIAARSD